MPAPQNMSEWEYHKMEGVELVELQCLGELGWELVAIKPSDQGAAYDEFYFKRLLGQKVTGRRRVTTTAERSPSYCKRRERN